MRIKYTFHALERMHQRSIDKELTILCVQDPDRSEQLEGVHRYIKKIDDKVVIVIYRKEHKGA